MKIKISLKSAAVAQPPNAGRRVVAAMDQDGVAIRAAVAADELGLGTTAAVRREAAVSTRRLGTRNDRVQRVRICTKSNPVDLKLYRSNAAPAQAYGHQVMAAAPTTVANYRATAAKAAASEGTPPLLVLQP